MTTTASHEQHEIRIAADIANLWADLQRADKAREADEVARIIALLLVRDDRIESLAHMERHFRAERHNSRLIACQVSSLAAATGLKALDPRRGSVVKNDSMNQSCTYYLSVNIEGAESAEREQRSHGCASEQQNLSRLAADCGFLVISVANDGLLTFLRNNTNNMQVQFGSERQWQTFHSIVIKQQADELLGPILCCCDCRRLGTATIELRTLPCCETLVCCSTECFDRHVESVHSESTDTVIADQDGIADENDDSDNDDSDDEESND